MSLAPTRRSMRMVWKTLRLRHVGMAFFWACSMLTFRSSILLSGEADTPEIGTIVTIASFVANMTVMLSVAGWVENDPKRIDRLPAWPLVAFVIVGLVLVDMAGRIGGTAMFPLLLAGSLSAGVGYGYFWGSWADCYGRMHPSRTSFYLPVAFLLTAALFLFVVVLSENLNIPAILLMIPLPIVSFACLRRSRAEEPDGRSVPQGGSKRSLAALSSLISLIVASLVLSCLFGFIWEFTVFSVNSVNDAHTVPLVANLVVAVALVGLVLYARTRIDLSVAYRIIVPIIVVLFAVLPFFWETNPVALNIIMSASFGVFDVIIWSLVSACAYDFAVSGYVIGGIVRSLSILSRLIGIGIGYLIMLVPNPSSVLIVGLSIGALYVLVMVGLFNFLRRKQSPTSAADFAEAFAVTLPKHHGSSQVNEKPLHETSSATESTPEKKVEPAEANPIEEADREEESDNVLFAAIAEDYGLTRREAEVLPYLARGRSAKVIAEALFVSESTIRTHIRRILEKTDLHSKQDIIDLIERYD